MMSPPIAGSPPETSPKREVVSCDHCGLIVPAGLVNPEAAQQFCCAGCEGVYRMIHGCDLGQYYRLRDAVGQRKSTAAPSLKDDAPRYAAFDDTAFLESETKLLPNGLRQVDLRLSNVQCAACAWLVERLPRVCPGALEARLSLNQMIARVTWDPEQTPLSKVAEALHRLGYPVRPVGEADARGLRIEQERRMLVLIGVAGVCAGNAMLLAVSLYLGLLEGMASEFESFLRWVSLFLGVLALAWPGALFFRGAWANWRARTVTLDLPIALALGVGGIAGTTNVVLGRGEIYFDSLCVLVFLLLVGRYLQMRQQRRAIDAVSLMQSLTPVGCEVWRQNGWVHLPIGSVVDGDRVRVASNQRLPVDGIVSVGDSSLDTSSLTGESKPKRVGPGDAVFAGSQNIGPSIEVIVNASGPSTRLSRLMEAAAADVSAKPTMIRFADRVAGIFTVALVGVAAVVFSVWWWTAGLEPALDHTVALLIVACPCALGLATPLTFALAVGAAARRDVLVKDPAVFEKLAAIDKHHPAALALDKTGTLTAGQPVVIDWLGDQAWQPVLGAMERDSNHPVGRALASTYDDGRRLNGSVTEDPRGGVSMVLDGALVRAGSQRWLSERGIDITQSHIAFESKVNAVGATFVGVALGQELVAAVWLADAPHPDTGDWLRHLENEGWTPSILSGDLTTATEQIAQAIAIPPQRIHAELTPEEKKQWVAQTQSAGVSVLMVGDGVNDAAALARADVGIAVKGGAEAALSVADAYTHRPGLQSLVELNHLSRLTVRAVRHNLAVSLGYNFITVGLAAAGLLTPWIAAILMPASSITVLSLTVSRLGRWKGTD